MTLVSERDCCVCMVVFRICFGFGGGCGTACGAVDPAVGVDDTADTANDAKRMLNGGGEDGCFLFANLFL